MISFGNPVWQLIQQSDGLSWMILGGLMLLSVICWTLFLYKYFMNRSKQRYAATLYKELRSVTDMPGLLKLEKEYASTPMGEFLTNALSSARLYLEPNVIDRKPVVESQLLHIKEHLYQLVDEMMHEDESSTGLLATTAAVAPLLGLFGTVWGLIQAFIGISQKQSADIVAVAPGIAQALTTTLAGLMVAIPAFVLYHILQAKSRNLEHRMVAIAERISDIINRIFVA